MANSSIGVPGGGCIVRIFPILYVRHGPVRYQSRVVP
jgi:hypothetical protein